MNILILLILLLITGGAICSIYIAKTWKIYNSDWMFPLIDMLRQANILARVWPTDDRFLSLHYSAWRHCIVGLICLLLIWFSGIKWLCSVLLLANLLYAVVKIPLQKARHRDWKEATQEVTTPQVISPIRKACTVVFLYPFYIYILLLVGYGFRP